MQASLRVRAVRACALDMPSRSHGRHENIAMHATEPMARSRTKCAGLRRSMLLWEKGGPARTGETVQARLQARAAKLSGEAETV